MNNKLKVLISGKGNPKNLGKMLEYYGVDVTYIDVTKPFTRGDHNIFLVFGVRPKNVLYALSCSGKKIWRFQGSDGFKPRPLIRQLLKIVKGNILYASSELKNVVGLKGKVLVTPINTNLFKPMSNINRNKDVLYYCPNESKQTYRMALCPDNATVLDGSVSHNDMPLVYSQHKKYVRWTTHNANPKMPFEALLCGCEVWVNGVQLINIPNYMLMENTIPKWIKYMEELLK